MRAEDFLYDFVGCLGLPRAYNHHYVVQVREDLRITIQAA